jgi:serine/threonine protein kinase
VMAESTNGEFITPLTRKAAERPVYKLTVSLISLYKSINRLYYENRAKQREDQGKSAWEDENHDYIVTLGEDILDRYVVRGRIGKGSFGQVLRAYDKVTSSDVAIKIIKNKKAFKKQANTELDILLELRSLDPSDKKHIVRLINHFEHRGHPCFVFEHLSFNLYELLKNTKFRGISLDLVHKFAKQSLETLEFLHSHNIIHCDLKVLVVVLVFNVNISFVHHKQCCSLPPKAREHAPLPAKTKCNQSHRFWEFLQRRPQIVLVHSKSILQMSRDHCWSTLLISN